MTKTIKCPTCKGAPPANRYCEPCRGTGRVPIGGYAPTPTQYIALVNVGPKAGTWGKGPTINDALCHAHAEVGQGAIVIPCDEGAYVDGHGILYRAPGLGDAMMGTVTYNEALDAYELRDAIPVKPR